MGKLHGTERGPRRIAAGISWGLFDLVLISAFALMLVLGPIGWLFALLFAILIWVVSVKAYGAFTGIRRFGPTS